MTRAVDDVVLATLRAALADTAPPGGDPVQVHDGMVLAPPTPGEPRIIREATPFLVFYSSVGYDDRGDKRNGFPTRRSVYWQITAVGLDRNQAKAAAELAREALRGRALDIPDHRSWRVSVESSQVIRRDDDAIRPDGKPLFYGVDEYAMSITTSPILSTVGA